MIVVAVVPARNREDTVGSTASALLSLAVVDRVVVVDDGSRDDTTGVARQAGADVLRLPANVGKGGAVAAGVLAAPDADVYLLIDADVGPTAAAAGALVEPVVAGDADMTVAVLPSAGTRAGLGSVRRLAAGLIRRASGFAPQAPLSGQRAVRGELLRRVTLAAGFGLETGLTIDAVRAGARIREIPVTMEHQHTGRGPTGFAHRARQGVAVVRAAWPRITSVRFRLGAIVVAVVVLVAGVAWSGTRWESSSAPLPARPAKVVVFGLPHLGFDDLARHRVPQLERLIGRGALAAMSVRTLSGKPSAAEGYASLGAGTRVKAVPGTAGMAFDAGARVQGGTAGAAMARETGRPARGDIVVLGYPSTVRLTAGKHLSSEAGALGDALHAAGRRTAVVGNADDVGSPDPRTPRISRPTAIALADRSGAVDTGAVDRADLLVADPTAPFGVRADPDRVLAATALALARADVVIVDPGDLDRASDFRRLALDRVAEAARVRALRRTDSLLGRLVPRLPKDTLLLVVSVSPPTSGWHLTPAVAVGPGVPHGWLHSPSTRRLGIVTITDLAPTILGAEGVAVPDGMIGHALRARAGTPDLAMLRRVDRDANYRERIYFPITLAYIIFQAAIYFAAMLAFSRLGGMRRAGPFFRAIVLAIAAFPLATFIFRAVPNVAVLGSAGILVLFGIDAVVTALAMRARRHPLSPLSWILGATAGLILADVATGARLQTSSLLGYSLHTAARFFGIGNTAFAVLASCAALVACAHVQYAPRRREALWAAAAFLALVIVIDGAPSLGDDVGGILTLVPVFGVTVLALSGRRLSWRALGTVALATVALVGAATGIDLLRPASSRTHLGQFASDVANGRHTFVTTIVRKMTTNLHVFSVSIWTWMVPIIAVFGLYVLVWEGRWAELLPARSALRVGVIAALAAGLLGFALNDSGVVVTALVFVYIGPFLTLLALHAERGEPVLLSPLAGAPPARPPVPARTSSS